MLLLLIASDADDDDVVVCSWCVVIIKIFSINQRERYTRCKVLVREWVHRQIWPSIRRCKWKLHSSSSGIVCRWQPTSQHTSAEIPLIPQFRKIDVCGERGGEVQGPRDYKLAQFYLFKYFRNKIWTSSRSFYRDYSCCVSCVICVPFPVPLLETFWLILILHPRLAIRTLWKSVYLRISLWFQESILHCNWLHMMHPSSSSSYSSPHVLHNTDQWTDFMNF